MSGARLAFSSRGNALIGQAMFQVLDGARRLEESGVKILHLELGNPRLPPPPQIVAATIAALQKGDVGYTYSAGLPALRQAIASRYNVRHHCAVGEKHVVISPANFLIGQFLDLCCDRGDRVAFFTPAFPTYWAAAAHIGLEVVPVPLDPKRRYELTHVEIDAALAARPRAIVVNSPNNPTGAVYARAALDYLADCCETAGIWLLADETYGEIAYGAAFHTLAKKRLPHVVVMSSFSKIFAIPGFRMGYAIAHPAVADKLIQSLSTQLSCLSAFTQQGCVAGLKVIDRYAADLRDRFRGINAAISDLINRSNLLRCTAPAAGFYLFVDISSLSDNDLEFCQRLLEEQHVAIMPGRSFGAAYAHHVRLATCGRSEEVQEGVTRLMDLARQLAPAMCA